MIIQHNMQSLNSSRNFGKSKTKLGKALEKLSSGYDINRAADNAAGLAVSENMRAQIAGLKQAKYNCEDGISLIQTFESALQAADALIQRCKQLAAQCANGVYQDEVDREAMQLEFEQLCDELDHVADTDFNGIVMLNGRRMADKFTFLTEDGMKWLTPSEIEFEEDSFVSTFRDIPGFPEIEMSVELLPEAKAALVDDRDLMLALEALNDAKVRSFYDRGIPKFSLEGLDGDYRGNFTLTVETEGSRAVISAVTPKSGKVDIARVYCTELPHYASSAAAGRWLSSSVATGSYTSPSAATPGNERYDLSKFESSYVTGKSATRAERQTYLDWINATPRSTAAVTADTLFDKDGDPLKFTWSLNGQEYETSVDSNGDPLSNGGATVPVYADSYTGGPQIFVQNLHFYYNDEDMQDNARLTLSVSHNGGYASGAYNGKQATGGYSYFDTNTKYLNIWLDHGNTTVTLTYNKDENKWYDSVGGSGSWADYGLTDRYYNYTEEYLQRYPSYRVYEERNLYHFYEDDNKLPDNFTLRISVTAPNYRTMSSSGTIWSDTSAHTDYSGGIPRQGDFKMEEYDPARPELGGIDYAVAKHGETYTYDGLTQPDGTVGVWRDSSGKAVDLAEEGIYLPVSRTSDITPMHDGMTITVSNPTMVGEDYIEADIRLFDRDRTVNAFRRVYDNITYADSLVIQAGARTKDGVEFTFEYSAEGIGDLEPDLDCTAAGLGIDILDLKTQQNANLAIDRLDFALNKVSMIRSSFGAIQNRLEHKIDNLNNTNENITAAESRIRDADMAKEMAEFTKNQIVNQAAQAMLVQANTLPQSVMSLLDA